MGYKEYNSLPKSFLILFNGIIWFLYVLCGDRNLSREAPLSADLKSEGVGVLLDFQAINGDWGAVQLTYSENHSLLNRLQKFKRKSFI